ncbi:uncharacterized protein K02A2.6-like [Rhagoletis pomonella]|uniref:uncharacterized protein K02A2.6-like n=1 Tax=Rhagoletis pomonella TaxID=28610 RepID=UPI0017819D0D|nr:uncharacterized protein K02A2.6-like [Rhagoletis pomonella]
MGASVPRKAIQTTHSRIGSPKLRASTRLLFGFGNKRIPLLGELYTQVKCVDKEKYVEIVVTNIDCGENLFEFDLFKQFGFEIQQISNVTETEVDQVEKVCTKYKELFEPALGTIKDFKASVYLKANATPKFCKSRKIPFSQMPQFKKEAERLTYAGIWKPIKFSNWASIVLAQKADVSIRICGDFKQVVNAQIDIERFPLPTREALFHAIRHGKQFSKIDLKDAYLQMELDDDSKTIWVVNTPLGLFQYQRLPYGIASAPAIFQKYLEQLLLRDVRLELVLQILQNSGIKCKKEKCSFLQDIIEYLGRQLSSKGILPDESGLRAVRDLKPPRDLKQVEAFMAGGPNKHAAP